MMLEIRRMQFIIENEFVNLEISISENNAHVLLFIPSFCWNCILCIIKNDMQLYPLSINCFTNSEFIFPGNFNMLH